MKYLKKEERYVCYEYEKKIYFCIKYNYFIFSINHYMVMAEEKLEWDKSWPTKIRIGGGPVGGGMYMGASCLANALREEFPQLEVIVEQTQAGVHNLFLLQSGEVEFSMGNTNTMWQAWYEDGEFKGKGIRSFRAVVPAWPNASTLITLKRSGMKNIKDLTGKVSGMMIGTTANLMMHQMKEAFGLDDIEIINLSVPDSQQALRNGIIKAYTLGYPNPATQELSMQVDLNVFGLSGEDAEHFLELYPQYSSPVTIPAGYYKGKDEPEDVVGFYVVYNAREDLPEDMVYTVLATLYKNIDVIEATWPSTSKTLREIGKHLQNMTTPYHKGSIKYFTEKGLKIPEELILGE